MRIHDESHLVQRNPPVILVAVTGANMRANIQYKLFHKLDFFRNNVRTPALIVVGLLTLLPVLVVLKWKQARATGAAAAAD